MAGEGNSGGVPFVARHAFELVLQMLEEAVLQRPSQLGVQINQHIQILDLKGPKRAGSHCLIG